MTVNGNNPAAAGSATAASWAWINACSSDDPAYFRLRYASLQRWQIWMQQLDGIRFSATETFLWDLPPDELRDAVDRLSGLGYPVELIDGVALAGRLPRLCEIPEFALHTAIEGAGKALMLWCGVGLTPEEFEEKMVDDDGRMSGLYRLAPWHVLHALGYTVTNVTERREPIIWDEPVYCRPLQEEIPAGIAVGLRIRADLETADSVFRTRQS